MLTIPAAKPNNKWAPGTLASTKVMFGPHGRYALAAVNTRFEAVTWMVWDAEQDDHGTPAIIRQESTAEAAISGLEEAV